MLICLLLPIPIGNKNMGETKIKFTAKKINLLFYAGLAIIITVSFCAVSLFLYKNFYQTIVQSEEIIILRGALAIETVDVEKFESVVEKIRQKISGRQLGEIADPF